MNRPITNAVFGDLFVNGEIVGIEEISVTYTQAPDTNSSSEDYQYLTLTTQTALSPSLKEAKNKESYYFNLSTKKWSIQNHEELAAIIEDFKKRVYLDTPELDSLIEKEESFNK